MEITVAVLGFIVVTMAIILVVVLRRPSPTVNLGQASEQLVMLAKQQLEQATQAGAATLETKKELIDQQVKGVKDELEKVTKLVTDIEKEREGKLSQWVSQASDQLLKLAKERLGAETQAGSADLEKKKQLIDKEVKAVQEQLDKFTKLVQEFRTGRAAKDEELATQIRTLGQQAVGLTEATGTLREALANPRARGQWGERMADDILRLAGLIEGVNYRRQKAIEGVGSRPDYVFLLPKGLSINMDVKFPWENYFSAVEAANKTEKETFEKKFLRDVRNKVKEMTNREYIDPKGGTVDCVLLFIPNDSIYAYIHQAAPILLDDALRDRVVFCSPLTLFAVLSVIRQAVDAFALQKASDEILSHLGRFKVEWQKFSNALRTLGDRLTSAQKAYEDVAGRRTRALERPLSRIEDIRQQRGLEVAPLLEHEILALAEAEETNGDEEEASSKDRAPCLSIA